MIRTKAITRPGHSAVAFWFLAALAVAAATLAILAFAPPALSAGPAKTNLTIRAQGLDLSGTVQSQRLRCVGNRTIRLYRQQGANQNPSVDDLIASDTSSRQGNRGVWSTGNTGMSGRFYVRTGRVPGCTGATSKTIRATNN